MIISVDPDKEFVKEMRESLKNNGGHCPCMTEKSEDTKCMCKDFRDKWEDPNFEGACHCGLYNIKK